MPYWQLYYYLIWTTFERLPLITAERERLICRTLHSTAREIGVVVHAMGNVTDHIHLLVSVPPSLSIADCAKRLKGASSRAVNLQEGERVFRWQESYGALSIGGRSLPSVAAYVGNQKEHHHQGTLLQIYEVDQA